MYRQLILVTSAASALAPAAAFGHHSPAFYDMTREVVVEGTVTKLDWKNPHILMTVETRGSGGDPVVQEIEAEAVSHARAMGLSRDAIAPGAHVVVRARPGRRGPGARALGLDVRTDDGVVFPLSIGAGFSIRPAVAAQAQGLAGGWVATIESFNGIFAESLPLTEAGRTVQAETRSRVQSPGVAGGGICAPFAPLMLSISPDLRTIEVGEASVVMSFEAVGMSQQRIVHLDQAEHPAGVAPSILGHSIGRWAGATLVIDTVAIAPHPLGNTVLPSTPSTHLVERLTLTQDRRRLEYAFTLEDPEYLAAPFSYTAIWDHRPDLEPSSEACDPDNARRALEE
jgi:hypothetical protein